MSFPLSYPELLTKLYEARDASGTERMLVFVTMPDPRNPDKTWTARVEKVSTAVYHDPGETNHSVWIHLTPPEEVT